MQQATIRERTSGPRTSPTWVIRGCGFRICMPKRLHASTNLVTAPCALCRGYLTNCQQVHLCNGHCPHLFSSCWTGQRSAWSVMLLLLSPQRTHSENDDGPAFYGLTWLRRSFVFRVPDALGLQPNLCAAAGDVSTSGSCYSHDIPSVSQCGCRQKSRFDRHGFLRNFEIPCAHDRRLSTVKC